MNKIIKPIVYLLVGIILISCKNEYSVQEYLVETQNKEEFITFDIAGSMLQLKNGVSDEAKEVLQTVKKINIAVLPIVDNEENYDKEKSKLKKIEKNPAYKQLIRVSDSGSKINIYYTGEDDSVNEVVVFGYGKEIGVGIARILGDKMKPSKIVEVMKELKVDKNSELINALKKVFEKRN
ncbi:DUF4252 domain-containing protein [Tenacibaculum maritimum]|uniref:DUF4252 domain-containing protein n=1 Tax=Tenacibaculum maritimum TaxID=107401 RepID=UPI0012E5BC39|nr:DUF4252 domain-containing protein [Tenacibaculum maritimum]CAA0170853.1 Probable lipoprotein precursor [Tenacibaculum maritimum]